VSTKWLRVQVQRRGPQSRRRYRALQQAAMVVPVFSTLRHESRGFLAAPRVGTAYATTAAFRQPEHLMQQLLSRAPAPIIPTRTRSFAPSTRDAGDISATAPPTAACFQKFTNASSFLQFCDSSWHCLI